MTKMTEKEARKCISNYLFTKGIFDINYKDHYEFEFLKGCVEIQLKNERSLKSVLEHLRQRDLKGKIKQAVDFLWEPFEPLDIQTLAREISHKHATEMIWDYVADYHHDFDKGDLIDMLLDYKMKDRGGLKDEANLILQTFDGDENEELQAAALVVLGKVKKEKKK